MVTYSLVEVEELGMGSYQQAVVIELGREGLGMGKNLVTYLEL